MNKNKISFTEEEEMLILDWLNESCQLLAEESHEELYPLITRLAYFFESKRKVTPRHYCYTCHARRKESEMHILKSAAFGKMSWVCNKCGDSRWKKNITRDENSIVIHK